MKMTIKREFDRPASGQYPGIFYDWDVVEKTSKAGNRYKALVLTIMISFNGRLMTVNNNVPLFWSTNGAMYKLSSTFNLLPDMDEKFEIDKLIGQAAVVTIVEKEYNGIIYSNVADIDKMTEDLPLSFKNGWLNGLSSGQTPSLMMIPTAMTRWKKRMRRMQVLLTCPNPNVQVF